MGLPLPSTLPPHLTRPCHPASGSQGLLAFRRWGLHAQTTEFSDRRILFHCRLFPLLLTLNRMKAKDPPRPEAAAPHTTGPTSQGEA